MLAAKAVQAMPTTCHLAKAQQAHQPSAAMGFPMLVMGRGNDDHPARVRLRTPAWHTPAPGVVAACRYLQGPTWIGRAMVHPLRFEPSAALAG